MIRARQLVGATLGFGAATLWLALLGLFTTPYLIHHLGVSAYGVFALIAIMSAYLSNLEFGFGHATVHFLSRARASGDRAAERAVLGTSVTVFLVAAVGAGALALLASPFVVARFVHGPAALHAVALDAIRLGALILLASFMSSFASCALQASGRFRVVVVARTIFGTLASATAVGAAAAGGDLRAVLVAQAAVALALCATLWFGLAAVAGDQLRPRIDRPTFRVMARYGAWTLVAGVAFQVLLQGAPTVLAGYGTTAQVAAFAVPNLVLGQLVTIATATSFIFLPFVSAASATPDRAHLRDVYGGNLRLTLLIMGPVAAFLAIFARPLLATWVDPAFAAQAAGPLRFLAGAALILSLSAAPADVARGLTRPAWVVVFTVVAATVTLAGSFALVSAHGAAGVAAALLIGTAVATIPFMFVVGRRLLDLRPATLLRALSGPLLAIAGAGATYGVGYAIAPTFLGAFLSGLVGTAAYVACALALLDERERAALSRRRPRAPEPPAPAPAPAAPALGHGTG